MKTFIIPSVIIIAGALVAFSLTGVTIDLKELKIAGGGERIKGTEIERKRLDFDVSPERSEHKRIRGNADAPVTIVEFSDYECVFCARLHPTLSQLLETYPDDVSWEYRHLPLVIHINARESALAAECVGDLAGNDAFWDFSDSLFDNQKSLAPELYHSLASELGVNSESLTSCMQSQDMSNRLLADEQIALALGASGTPFNAIVYPDGEIKIVSGALPYTQWVDLIEYER